MARKKQSYGQCAFCGGMYAKSGMRKHLQACLQRNQAIDTANEKDAKACIVYDLQVQEAWRGEYWLHLEMKDTATLRDLDRYLRAIWLECCGHMSQFSIDGWDGDEIPKSWHIADVFKPGVEVTHIYDFGESSYLLIKSVAVRPGKPLTRHRINMLARNTAPVYECDVCGEPASFKCMECVIEYNQRGYLCDVHSENHPHIAYGELRALLNSPRVGMCGYDGPAEPPY
ncbi:MAG: hypothetical protein E4H27_06825 [Anaerolineales bacterium]|nr:MAG: hypothetical protein E4H27_06825 [Anaerolineales bacterium]